jgi:hypothetical protein
MPTRDHLIEQVRGLRAFLSLDAIEAEFVADEQIPAGVPSQCLSEALA